MRLLLLASPGGGKGPRVNGWRSGSAWSTSRPGNTCAPRYGLGLTLDAVVYLYAPENVLVQRLPGRAAQGRSDDTAAVIRHRLDVFTTTTSPLIAYYRDRGILCAVDADRPPDVITTEVLTRLSSVSPTREKT